jgi:hypothetical protein
VPENRHQAAKLGPRGFAPALGSFFFSLLVKHRDVEITVVQGLGRQLWKWGFALEGKAITGQAATKAEAVREAMSAIDRALAPKKLRLIRPDKD